MDYESLEYKDKSIWQFVDRSEYDEIYSYGERYKNFLDESKTEREACKYIIKKAEEKGFKSLDKAVKDGVKPGDKIYINNKGKSAALFVIGKDLTK